MSAEGMTVEQVQQLITKGEAVLGTHRPTPNAAGFPTLDRSAFSEWRTQALNYLTSLLGPKHVYVETFTEQVKSGHREQVKSGLGILKAVREDLVAGRVGKVQAAVSPVRLIEQLCSRFHLVARQLRSRHESRATLDIADEYDVQDLMHALLWLHFEDVRHEEYTPSYGGKTSRMDFLLKKEAVVVETKKTRPSMGPKELSSQLIEDTARYQTHPDCKTLICFVYDPDGYIPNPRGMEADLSRDGDPFPVRVLIRP